MEHGITNANEFDRKISDLIAKPIKKPRGKPPTVRLHLMPYRARIVEAYDAGNSAQTIASFASTTLGIPVSPQAIRDFVLAHGSIRARRSGAAARRPVSARKLRSARDSTAAANVPTPTNEATNPVAPAAAPSPAPIAIEPVIKPAPIVRPAGVPAAAPARKADPKKHTGDIIIDF